LDCTLDQLDEEGELVKVAAKIAGFSCSTEVEEVASVLEDASIFSTLHVNLYECIAALFVLASKPVLCVT
jgi:hypothetical protein